MSGGWIVRANYIFGYPLCVVDSGFLAQDSRDRKIEFYGCFNFVANVDFTRFSRHMIRSKLNGGEVYERHQIHG